MINKFLNAFCFILVFIFYFAIIQLVLCAGAFIITTLGPLGVILTIMFLIYLCYKIYHTFKDKDF